MKYLAKNIHLLKKSHAFPLLSSLILILFVAFSYDIASAQQIEKAESLRVDTLNVRKFSPTGALMRSAFVPGWGQFYNRKYIKGSIITAGESYLIASIYTYWKEADRHRHNFEHSDNLAFKASEFTQYTNARDSRNLRFWILAGAIFYSMFDAYVDAQLADFNQSDKAYQVYVAPAHNDGVQLVMNFKIK